MYTRSRSKGALPTVASTGFGRLQAFNNAYSSPTNYTQQRFLEGNALQITWDREIPDFHTRRALGEVFFNDFLSTKTSTSYFRPGWYKTQRQTPLYTGESPSAWRQYELSNIWAALGRDWDGGSFRFNPIPEAVVSQLIAKNQSAKDIAYNQALAGTNQTDALLMVTLAELKKTVGLLTTLGSQLVALLSSKTGGQLLAAIGQGGGSARDIRSRLKAGTLGASKEWLMYRYGILPLIFEIQGVIKAANQSVRPPRLTSRGLHVWDDMIETAIVLNPSIYYPGWSILTTVHISARVSAGILYEPVEQDLTYALGLRLSSVPESLLELAKWSFVAGWFWDLQNYVRGITAMAHANPLGSWITERYNVSCTHTFTPTSPIPGYVTVNGVQKPVQWNLTASEAAQVITAQTITRRTPGVGKVLLPKTPSWRPQLNVTRAVDAFALIATALMGKPGALKNART